MASSALTDRKQNGAYYTDEAVAKFLTTWALSASASSVVDPSCGDGVFLRQALEHAACSRVVGIDISPDAVAAARSVLPDARVELIESDFFAVSAKDLGQFDAVVGNPPFVRFHRFTGAARERALSAARSAGVSLSALSSAWAPLLVHATQFVRRGGRLAMVAPGELLHAAYALPVLRYLHRSFSRLTIVTFDHKLFPDLSQDTLLVLASGRGHRPSRLLLLNLADQWQLDGLLDRDPDLLGAPRRLPAAPLLDGRQRVLEYLLPDGSRRLYGRLRQSSATTRMGAWAAVSIGYVTGSNDYFHLSKEEASRLGIEPRFLLPALRRADELKGLVYSEHDWSAAADTGAKSYVLSLPAAEDELPEQLRAYVRSGEREGIHLAYKCRVRKPWYVVPGLAPPDGFLTYMVHLAPRMVVNQARAVAPNSLLAVFAKPGAPSLEYLSMALMTSLGLLSAELEGHSLGGGLLKIEPGEASRLVVPACASDAAVRRVEAAVDAVDDMLRVGDLDAARSEADSVVLRHGIGLSRAECDSLREGWLRLRERRLNR